MTEKESIIKTFVDNFVLKDKRERCYAELTSPEKRNKFIDKLNHKWSTVLNMNYLTQITKGSDFIDSIQELLKFEDNDLCYVISNYSDIDDGIISFKDVAQKAYSRGFATLLLNLSATTLFLSTEQVQGLADKFIGRSKRFY